MVAAPAHGTARHPAAGELRVAARAPSPELEQRPAVEDATVYGQHHARTRLHEDDVVVGAAVLVGCLERPPPRREREATVTTREVAYISHPTSMNYRRAAGVSWT